MPRQEFLATGLELADCDNTKNISSPTAAALRENIIRCFADIKTQNILSTSKTISARANVKIRGPARSIQIQTASDLKVNLGLNKFTA
jgi:hypothetical protein